jgi:hypothetical protein
MVGKEEAGKDLRRREDTTTTKTYDYFLYFSKKKRFCEVVFY